MYFIFVIFFIFNIVFIIKYKFFFLFVFCFSDDKLIRGVYCKFMIDWSRKNSDVVVLFVLKILVFCLFLI